MSFKSRRFKNTRKSYSTMQLLLVPTPTKSQLSVFALPGDCPVAPFKVVFFRLGRTSVEDSGGDTSTATSTSKFPHGKFVQVAVGPENTALHQGSGLTALPYAHDVIYHAQVGLVEELRMNQKRFGDSEQILQSYNDGAWVNK